MLPEVVAQTDCKNPVFHHRVSDKTVSADTDEVSLPGLDELDDLDSSDDFNNDSINNQDNQVINNSYATNNNKIKTQIVLEVKK